MSCHHHHDQTIVEQILSSNFLQQEYLIVIAMLAYGIIGGFTHCIAMCGPIAAGQMSLRLMHLEEKQLTGWNKFKCALSLSYYFGKALTYGMLAVITKLISVSLKDYVFFQYLAFFLLVLAAFVCLQIALTYIKPSFSFRFIKFFDVITKLATKIISGIKLTPFGWRGLFMGMILGLIPCGLVVSAIMLIIVYSSNLLVAFLSAFSFGIGTLPALFLTCYLGQNLILRLKKYLNIIYAILMIVNFLLLINFSYKVWLNI